MSNTQQCHCFSLALVSYLVTQRKKLTPKVSLLIVLTCVYHLIPECVVLIMHCYRGLEKYFMLKQQKLYKVGICTQFFIEALVHRVCLQKLHVLSVHSKLYQSNWSCVV